MDDAADAEEKYPEEDVDHEILARALLEKDGEWRNEDREDYVYYTHTGKRVSSSFTNRQVGGCSAWVSRGEGISGAIHSLVPECPRPHSP